MNEYCYMMHANVPQHSAPSQRMILIIVCSSVYAGVRVRVFCCYRL